MKLIQTMRIHNILYWAPTGYKDEFGIALLDSVVEITGRWEKGTDETITINNTQVKANSKIYTSQETVVGGYLMLGVLADLQETELTQPPDAADEIVSSFSLPDLHGEDTLYWSLV